ncbi:hypothetical protein [Pseudooctadecabacter sp.]|uniref:hypothetical protein n=1 Tax=Pseudooctadecabacter sp. TaxID=1966338 RepID=UPI0035C80B32
MRIVTGVLGALAGAALGVFGASVLEETALTWGIMGALLGGFFGAVFSFLVIVGLLMISGVVLVIGWNIYFGGS